MPESDVIEAPNINPHAPNRDERWKREYLAFQNLLPELLKTNRDRFAAVYNGAVVALADTFKDAAIQAYSICGYVPLHVGKVTDAAVAPVRIPSARVGGAA